MFEHVPTLLWLAFQNPTSVRKQITMNYAKHVSEFASVFTILFTVIFSKFYTPVHKYHKKGTFILNLHQLG